MAIRQVVSSPVVQRALIAIVAAIVALAYPEAIQEGLFVLIGVVAILVGVVELVGALRTRRIRDVLLGIVMILGGIAVVFGEERADRLFELLVAATLIVRALVVMVQAYLSWRSDEEDPFWPVARGVILLLAGAALVLIPSLLLQWVILVVAISWIVGGAIVIVNTIGEDPDTPVPSDVVSVVQSKSMEDPLRQQVTDAVFEGFESKTGGIEFAALMAFATAIATFGVKSDSTAVVIGAMLIAPLMSPIMALSAATLMGWPDRAGKAARRVGIGVVIGVGFSYLMSLVSPEFVAITSNSEVLSRISPTILDLLIALAAGAAGGYAMTHPHVGNSLPGVAIAVALAPPLAVVGYSIEEFELSFALGAFLLFLTNLVGIVVAAGIAFVVSGYSPWSQIEQRGEQAKRSLVLIGISFVAIAIPLAIIGQGIIGQTTARTNATAVVEDWLGDDSDYAIVSLRVTGEEVTVELEGSGDLPDTEEMAREISEELDREVEVIVDVIPRERTVVRATPDGEITDP